jgi:hypothetical protein
MATRMATLPPPPPPLAAAATAVFSAPAGEGRLWQATAVGPAARGGCGRLGRPARWRRWRPWPSAELPRSGASADGDLAAAAAACHRRVRQLQPERRPGSGGGCDGAGRPVPSGPRSGPRSSARDRAPRHQSAWPQARAARRASVPGWSEPSRVRGERGGAGPGRLDPPSLPAVCTGRFRLARALSEWGIRSESCPLVGPLSAARRPEHDHVPVPGRRARTVRAPSACRESALSLLA